MQRILRLTTLAPAAIAALAISALVFGLAGCSDDQMTQTSPTAHQQETNLDDTDTEFVLQEAPTDKSYGLAGGVATYEVTIENLTPATGDGASQPFSPPILFTQQRGARPLFDGRYATAELAGVAEDALNGPLVEALLASDMVGDVVVGDGVIMPGQSASFEITSADNNRKLSAAFMLVNTNDAFGWLRPMGLPLQGERSYMVHAFDAGTEKNTELAGDIPGPCCGSPGMGTEEMRPIHRHRGIMGFGDLDPETYGWDGPVARVTIRRLDPVFQITLENLTPETVPGGSQVFSPPVLASHGTGLRMFSYGFPASDALAALAEDGQTAGLEAMLADHPSVHGRLTGEGPVFPGSQAVYELESSTEARFLSLAFMLVNTNDAFSGGTRIPLPRGGSMAYYLRALDAGSEVNTELASDIPGPCCGNPGMGTDEDGRVRFHPGIQGVGDLSVEDYGWDDPVGMLTITRIK
jgi:hypothetical protein